VLIIKFRILRIISLLVVFNLLTAMGVTAGLPMRIAGSEQLAANRDSIEIKALLDKAREYSNTNPDLTRQLSEVAALKAKKSNHLILYCSALNSIGNAYAYQGKLPEALSYFRRGLKMLEENHAEKSEKFKFLHNIGRTLINQGNYLEGLDLLVESYKIARNAGDKENISLSLFSLGQVYYDLAKYDVAMEYYSKSQYYAKLTNHRLRLSQLLNDMGNVSSMQKKYSQALAFYNQSLKIKEEIQDEVGMAITIQNKGSVYEIRGDNPPVDKGKAPDAANYTEALNYYYRALEIAQRLNLIQTESLILSNIGSVQIKLNQVNDGIVNCKQALLLAEKSGTLVRIQEACDNLTKAYKKLNKPAEELFYFKRYIAAKDSIYKEDNQKKLNQIQFEQELELRQVKQKAETDKQLEIARIQQIKIRLLLALLLFMLVIIGFISWQRKKIILNYKELVKKNLELMTSEEELNKLKESLTEPVSQYLPLIKQEENQKKQSKTNISEDQTEKLYSEIQRLLIQEKLFLDRDFTMQLLVKKLNSNTAYVSRVINDKYGKSFSTLINEFRIKEARKLLADHANNQLTIEGISWNVGFKSVTSFNVAFKKYTGISPSFFKMASQQKSD
jgi:AraC-like DNA-binding protein